MLPPISRYMARQINTKFSSSTFKYRRILALVVESGAIYSSALVIEITLYFLHTNAFYIIYDPIAQLTVSKQTLNFVYRISYVAL